MNKWISGVILMVVSAAVMAVGTVRPHAADPTLLLVNGAVVSGTKYVDPHLANTGSQGEEFIRLEGSPLSGINPATDMPWCNNTKIFLNPAQVGRITGPLDLSLVHSTPVNLTVRDYDDDGCWVQAVTPNR